MSLPGSAESEEIALIKAGIAAVEEFDPNSRAQRLLAICLDAVSCPNIT
jgi:hypothetical protein